MTPLDPRDRPRPDDARLTDLLESILDGPVDILERSPSGSGTFPKEIVRCVTPDGRERALFCKYSAPRGEAHGHRRGIGYEARVYRDVLARFDAPTPGFVGAGGDEATGEWLALDYLDAGTRLSDAWQSMPDAAAWLGAFHAAGAPAVARAEFDFLTVYDRQYYLGWGERTVEFAAHRDAEVPWLPSLAAAYRELVPLLLDCERSLIHGEFTVKNVMLRDGLVYPTDWETAAVAPGEIDLMCLVDRWPSETVDACIAAYAAARWPVARRPGGTPWTFDDRLLAAELYLHFRWLGETPELMLGKKRVWRFGRLEEIATRLGARV